MTSNPRPVYHLNKFNSYLPKVGIIKLPVHVYASIKSNPHVYITSTRVDSITFHPHVFNVNHATVRTHE